MTYVEKGSAGPVSVFLFVVVVFCCCCFFSRRAGGRVRVEKKEK